MSDSIRRLVPSLALLMAGLPLASLVAQPVDSQTGIEAQQARVDSLLQEYEAVRQIHDSLTRVQEVRDSLERAEREPVPLDTASVGPYLLVGPPGAVDRGLELVGEVWREQEEVLQGAVDALAGTVFLVHRPGTDPEDPFGELADRPGHHELRLPRRKFEITFVLGMRLPQRRGLDGPRRNVEITFRGVAQHSTRRLPLPVVDWLGDGRPPGAQTRSRPHRIPASGLAWSEGEVDARRSLGLVYRELATRQSLPVRRCYQGEAEACLMALTLDDPGPDWSGWYSAEELRRMVMERSMRSPSLTYTACVEGRDHDACLGYFAEGPGPPPPLSPRARATFLRHLLVEAEPERLRRLLQDPTPESAIQALEQVAGGPLELAAARWHESVLEARPAPYHAAVRTRLSTLFWLLVIAALAMRSTRWRLG